MNSFTLALRYLRHRWLVAGLNVLILASGIALMVALLLVNAGGEDVLGKNLRGIDLVVGAKGSPMQMILSSVFHADVPTGNIPLVEAEKLQKHPLVKKAIPLALGDNLSGFRIIGTTFDYAAHYQARLAEGVWFKNRMEAVLGSEVAEKTKIKTGASFSGAHGLAEGGEAHEHARYTVVGVLAPTGTVLDRLVLTPVESVWHVHEHHDDHEEHDEHEEHKAKEITSLLITYASPMAAVSLPRVVNSTTSMQAASPAFETARLMALVGTGVEVLRAVGGFLLLLAGLGIFVSLMTALDERRYDLALLKSLGASPLKLLGLIVSESLIMAMAGLAIGLVFGHAGVEMAARYWGGAASSITGWVFLSQEWWLLVYAAAIAVLAAVIPVARVKRIDIFATLARR